MRILITGGAGMIGFNIAKHYASGHEVVVIDNLERSKLLGHEISPTRKMFNTDALLRMGVRVIHEDVAVHRAYCGKSALLFDFWVQTFWLKTNPEMPE